MSFVVINLDGTKYNNYTQHHTQQTQLTDANAAELHRFNVPWLYHTHATQSRTLCYIENNTRSTLYCEALMLLLYVPTHQEQNTICEKTVEKKFV